MRRLFILIVGALMLASLAGATPCATGTSVLTLGQCTFGGLTFDNWSVSVSGLTGATVFFGPGSNVTSSAVNVQFQVVTNPSPTTGPGDILLMYSLTGGVQGVDIFLGNTSGGVTITENACGSAFVQGSCSNELATLVVSSGGSQSGLQMFETPVSQVFISKDIQLQTGSTLSDFVNSAEIPEPFTYILMGSGLLALGLIRRKVRKN